MIKLFLYFVIIYCGYKILKSALKNLGLGGGEQSQVNTGNGNIANIMIQDPQCKVYFARNDGVCLRISGKKIYFCSEECRDRYIAAHK